MHDNADTSSLQEEQLVPDLRPQISRALVQVSHVVPAPVPGSATQPQRGRPVSLPAAQLWLGVLWCMLDGMNHYEQLRRWLASHTVGGFAPLLISTDAIVKRLLQAGLEPLDALFTQFEQWVPTSPSTCDLAPFASHIVALDETTLDAVTRHLVWQRQHPKGSTALLAGKLAGLFDIRQQRWLRLEYFASAVQNCKVGFLTLLDDLPWHSLLLFDLGYFSFPCFDYLTERGYWWSSKLPLILQQIAVVLLLAHLWQISAEAGCDPFDVSLPLLVQYVPQLIRNGQHPIDWMLIYGKPLGFIRPHSRLQVRAPHLLPEQLVLPPADLVLVRKARYVTYSPRPGRRKKKKTRQPVSPSPPPL